MSLQKYASSRMMHSIFPSMTLLLIRLDESLAVQQMGLASGLSSERNPVLESSRKRGNLQCFRLPELYLASKESISQASFSSIDV